ncbi:MAG TPA: M24 family metallopeptidase [Longimicrobiales bacterium]|nr:M24 family metallopeptidase [Longimicrobiales bacterium]
MALFTGSREFTRIRRDIDAMQAAVRAAGLDGWLLYDLHARNDVTTHLIGLGDMSRRFFVLVPAQGDPIAIIHGIEQAPWDQWPWQKRVYVGWQQLGTVLRETLGGLSRVAMEYSPMAAVPAMDLIPAGIVELVRSTGVDVVSSGDLVTRFYAIWTPEQLRSHHTAAAALAQVAHASFIRLARAVEDGERVTEVQVRAWVIDDLQAHGAAAGADAIAATGLNAADPHYSPQNGGAVFERGDLVLLDLWTKEAEDMVYADQTWMAYLGTDVPARAAALFAVIRDARDAAVEFVDRAWQEGRTLAGGAVDDVTRRVVSDAGYGDYFIHRTGHSIDRAVHGMGPNIDNLETNETRLLVPGVGFSIEPGIYISGDIGMRTEIDVYMGEGGPEVTTPRPQSEITALMGL